MSEGENPGGPVLAFKRETQFQFLRIGELLPITRPYLVKGILPARGVAFIAGESRSGKTFVALDLTLRIAHGATTAMKRKVTQGGVLYIAAEDPDGVQNRAIAWTKYARANSTGWALRDDPPFRLVRGKIDLLDPDSVQEFAAGARLEKAAFEQAGERLAVIVLDTFSRGLPGVDENTAPEMSRAIQALEDLGNELDSLILVVAHHGKAGGNSGIRGWSGIDAASDATITITRKKEDKNVRYIEFTKVKNGPDGGILEWRIESVVIGQDDDGDDMDAGVAVLSRSVVDKDSAAPVKRVSLKPEEGVILRAAVWVTDHGRTVVIPPSEQAPGWAKGVTREDVRARAHEMGLCDDLSLGEAVTLDQKERDKVFARARQRFHRAAQGLVAKGKIRVSGDVFWVVGQA